MQLHYILYILSPLILKYTRALTGNFSNRRPYWEDQPSKQVNENVPTRDEYNSDQLKRRQGQQCARCFGYGVDDTSANTAVSLSSTANETAQISSTVTMTTSISLTTRRTISGSATRLDRTHNPISFSSTIPMPRSMLPNSSRSQFMISVTAPLQLFTSHRTTKPRRTTTGRASLSPSSTMARATRTNLRPIGAGPVSETSFLARLFHRFSQLSAEDDNQQADAGGLRAGRADAMTETDSDIVVRELLRYWATAYPSASATGGPIQTPPSSAEDAGRHVTLSLPWWIRNVYTFSNGETHQVDPGIGTWVYEEHGFKSNTEADSNSGDETDTSSHLPENQRDNFPLRRARSTISRGIPLPDGRNRVWFIAILGVGITRRQFLRTRAWAHSGATAPWQQPDVSRTVWDRWRYQDHPDVPTIWLQTPSYLFRARIMTDIGDLSPIELIVVTGRNLEDAWRRSGIPEQRRDLDESSPYHGSRPG